MMGVFGQIALVKNVDDERGVCAKFGVKMGNKVSAPRFKGKLKFEIADEAFKKFGKNATRKQVDVYFKLHGLHDGCERSMYLSARRRANGIPNPPRRSYRRIDEEKMRKDNIVVLIARAKALAYDLGGWDALEGLIKELRNSSGSN